MNKLTYRQAYDKIIEAYFRDEIKPLDPCFCFCGTLNMNDIGWCDRTNGQIFPQYDPRQLMEMEDGLLEPLIPYGAQRSIFESGKPGCWQKGILRKDFVGYEDALFAGMSAALDVLKEIHRSRGENVDEDIPAFTKRELINSVVSAR